MRLPLQLLFFTVLMGFASGCGTESGPQESATLPKLTKMEGFPESFRGCGCYFATNEADLKAQKFIYLEKYGAFDPLQNRQMIALDGKQIEFTEQEPNPDFILEIEYDSTEEIDQELSRKTGTLSIILTQGDTLQQAFVGECGC